MIRSIYWTVQWLQGLDSWFRVLVILYGGWSAATIGLSMESQPINRPTVTGGIHSCALAITVLMLGRICVIQGLPHVLPPWAIGSSWFSNLILTLLPNPSMLGFPWLLVWLALRVTHLKELIEYAYGHTYELLSRLEPLDCLVIEDQGFMRLLFLPCCA